MKQVIFDFEKDIEQRRASWKELVKYVTTIDADVKFEVLVRNQSAGKTVRQLKGHFGWILKQVSDETGYHTEELHEKMKMKFLVDMYIQDPQGSLQEQWMELLYFYREDPEKYKLQRERISLEWIEKDQMREYMDKVITYWISEGIPVEEPDPEKRSKVLSSRRSH